MGKRLNDILNDILNYNSNNRKFRPNWEKLFSQLEKKCSLTGAQNLRSKAIFRTLLVVFSLLFGTVSAWAQITPTTDTNSNGTYEDNEKNLYLIQTNQFQSFYITPNGDNLNTVNLPHESMLWYFLEAENDNGTQYYYIVNNSTGKYICNTDYASKGRTIKQATFDSGSTDKFKFKLVENNATGSTGYYNINIKPNGGSWIGLNKQGGNALATNGIRLTDNNYISNINSRWKFIPYDGTLVWPDPPFTLSSGESKTYYRIRNKKTNTLFISTDQSTSKVIYSNAESNDMAWYFEEAPSDNGLMKYYYIINPAAGNKYMYYDGTATNGSDQSNAVSIKAIDEEGVVADRFLFVVVQAAVVGNNDTPINGYYMIVPKLLIDKLWNSNSIGTKTTSNGDKMGIITGRSTDGYSHWSFVTTEYPMHCVTPSITFDNATGKVTITTSPAGSTIHYTTDGETEPTSSSGTSYSEPFSITGQTTIKAIASKDGYENSEVATKTIYKVATPTIQDNGNNTISIVCATAGVTIYYTTDGSNPTTSSTEYTGPLTDDVSGKTIKAIAVKSEMINSDVGSGSVTMQCAKPEFTRSGDNITISCSFPTSGVSIYYTTDGSEPTSSSSKFTSAFAVTTGQTIKAIAIAEGYTDSEIATKRIFNELTPTDGKYLLRNQDEFENFIDMASTEENADKHYVLQADVTAGSEIPETFTGIFDGGMHTISSPSHALFNSINGGTVKNVILSGVSISGGTNAGAIANVVTGDSRIYNCGVLSGSVGGSDDVGGIVGQLDGSSRVINCYSYANITGGSNVGGIVGNNKVASTASNIKTMVMNCMFYGDITGGSTKSPVYGGQNINNLHGGLNTYNYYAYSKLPTSHITEGKYNCALAVEDKYLNRFEFYRQLLNSNRRLAAKYASTTSTTVNATDMMKWVLETADRTIDTPKPYPILKAQDTYPSIINYDTRDLADYSEAHRNEGLKTGTLTVNISIGSGYPTGAAIKTGKSSITLIRTDKDFDRYNFNYDKVQLPYYNEVGTGNCTHNKVVTGWKITAIDAVTDDPYTSSNYPSSGVKDFPDHNYADRKSSNKDLYSVSGRVFSQGAYFDVPYGVSSITIEPYWGNAAYVADEYLDVVYSTGYAAQSVSQLDKSYDTQKITIDGSEQTVHKNITDALKALGNATVYDNAVVLVGNLHQGTVPANSTKPFTIMSADLDHDNEPDYSMIYHHNNRQSVSPIRFDFINIPGTAQAQKPNGTDNLKNFTIFLMRGWFEITNTCIVYSNQVEYENNQSQSWTKTSSPLILLGGEFEQFVSTRATTIPGNTIYIHVGGNVKIDNFGVGTHGDGSQSTPHIPVSVTGGEYEGFYLTGTYNPNAAERTDNAECYISGGHFVEAAGACQEPINGNVHWQIYNADIDAFYGGGINDARPIKGTITTDIYNSHVTLFCGGPKFGNMTTGKAVTTNAEGCVFDKYFGAGYGGLSYSRQKYIDESGFKFGSNPYTTDKEKYFDGETTNASSSHPDYGKKGPGVATDFDYEFFVWSTGVTGARMYVKFASFSLAQCDNVFSNLKGCTINKNFYGGGSLGKVTGTATSVLENCTVNGNVFGGGYSGTLPSLEVRDGGFTKIPEFNSNSGMFEPGEFSGTTTYTWKNAAEAEKTLENGKSGSDPTNHYIYTNQDLTTLGQVGHTVLTIKGTTKVGGIVEGETPGGVFGGGDMSAVNGSTQVNIEATDATDGVVNVFGGGNTADVVGTATVTMTGGKVSTDIYGGGKGQTTVVTGDVTVGISAGTVSQNVYGGSALGTVNATAVTLSGGTVSGSVFGGGLGQTSPSSIAAQNLGNTTVTISGGSVATAVYGGSNANGVLKGNATVTITGGTVGTVVNPITDAVFGGGFGEPTLVEGDVEVNIGTSGQESAGATINGNVYGGGALGNVNTSKPASELVFDATKKVDVNLYKGTINGDVFGGGLGQKNGVNGAESDILSYVGGDVNVTLDGAKVPGSIFGCNNLNGTPKGHVRVLVKKTVDSSKPTKDNEDKDIDRTARTTYDVTAVYGGGNQADYIPTNALLDPAVEGNKVKVDSARTEVIIEGCEATSINYVYGGGNAAAVPATEVTIKGSYIINNVYGGGNGSGEGNPGANVGTYNNGATDYGTGKAKTRLLGGYINNVYGGSNTKGDIRGGTDVRTKERTDNFTGTEYCSDLNVGNVFGAGSKADMDGDVTIILECMPEDYVDQVFGGAEQATVNGDVTLVVTSGKFGRVFGGNNAGGDIRGSITVCVSEDGCEHLEIGELYGGGNQAPYSIYGCTKTDNGDGTYTWTAKTGGSAYTGRDPAIRADVEVYVFSCTSIGRIFGGGNEAEVIGNTRVWVNTWKGYINGNKQNNIGKIGQVFGGGNAAKVTGNTQVDIGTAQANEGEEIGVKIESGDYLHPESNTTTPITAGIYGGGYSADVDGNTTLNIGTKDQNMGISIAGDIFGGGFGETTHVTGDVTVNIGANIGTNESPNYVGFANITGDVYGGSAKGKVNSHLVSSVETATEGKETQVNLYGGTINGDLYGGGLGEDNDGTENDHAADVYGPVTVNVEGGKVTNVFGCNNVLGSPQQTATVNIHGMVEPVEPATYTITNVYGGGNQAAYTGTGGVSVAMTNGWVNDVFGGGLGTTAIVNEATNVTLSGGSVINDVYGGGSQGNVTGAVTMTLSGGTVGRDVYGGGALASTNTSYNSGSAPANTYVTNVTLAGATITGNLYGGGLGDLSSLGEGHSDVAANVGGSVKVAVTAGSATNVFGCNNTNGAPQSTVDVEIGTKTGDSAPYTYGGTGTISGSVYGGGNVAAYTGNSTVKLYGGTVNTNVYGGGLGATAIVTGNTSVIMEGGTVKNDVFGGGSEANVTGNVNVSIAGGTVTYDVYGGGALANTNTANWNTSTETWEVESSASTDYYYPVKHVKKDDTVVTGYYTRSGSEGSYTYTEITAANTKAAEGVTYYKKINLPANIHNVAANGTTYKTTVSLTGGTIGNAYGGGLGRLANGNDPEAEGYLPAVTAMVYGDVLVTVDGTKFTKESERVDGKNIPTTGRVFGCNNINGTPKGSVKVWVKQTKRLDGGAHVKNQFEIQSVYGGGNKSHYVPQTYDPQTEFGQRTQVLIEGCDKTSIEGVYGGGNASDVPFTDVTIEGSFQIGYVFGGGNGGDKINKGSGWEENPGANVTNYTNVLLHGGTIGEAFGGSDSKGSVGGFELTKDAQGICPLLTENIYGASKEADSDGDVTLNLSGCENNVVDKVFGGSYNANVRGNITINITSGIYTSVFGGNDRKGTIGGNITINVEEVDQCNPIIIQNLFGGGSRADYPGTGALTYKGTPNPTGPTEHPDSYTSFTSGNITINVRAATRIDNIFGGCDNAKVTGNTAVNINMVKGSMAGNGFTRPTSYTGDPIPNMHTGEAYAVVSGLTAGVSVVSSYYTRSGNTYTQAEGTAVANTTYYDHLTGISVIDDAIGTIGNVYGGGNQGDVDGNTSVNIGTLKDIAFVKTPTHLTANGSGKYNVLGANITGDVFGGGNDGNVTGNTTVNIQTADYSTPPTDFVGVNITNGSVYGGGSLADVLGNTTVTMAGGYVYDGVYGGGLMGSVGTYTKTTNVTTESNGVDHSSPLHKNCIGKPTACTAGGTCTVVVSGGQVGPLEVATKGMKNEGGDGPVDVGFVFGAGRGDVLNPALDEDADFYTYVNKTDVTISGTALIMASVYGGGENGRVLGDTHVKIQGGQIGSGDTKVVGSKTVPKVYTDEEWASETPSTFKECLSWDYKSPYLPHDIYAQTSDTEDAKIGTDGHSYYGSVFGGGSGYFPYLKEDGTHEWLRSAGVVYGNTVIDITGGHILTCVYGGNETTDVGTYTNNGKGYPTVKVSGGKCTINMVGGTIGVPRTDEDATSHPVTCYLFGAGKGDQRTRFNTWTNVHETEVNVSGTARIFGSVFGGGEDGHVLGDSKVNIGGTVKIDLNGDDDTEDTGETFTAQSNLKIGTTGTSYVDGNVFGGGRGFSGLALTAGSNGGNTEVNISAGQVLGSVYGGGRLASVGIDFTPADDPLYGQMTDDTDEDEDGVIGPSEMKHGHISINISGGTIGTTTAETGHPVGGNVFGGSMGRITLLDNSLNPLWPKQAVSKRANITISGGEIKNSVYGGSEYGIVRDKATITISDGIVDGNVYGGGYGSEDETPTLITAGDYSSGLDYIFTPMIWTGCVSGDTEVNISGGKVKKNVYGGGEMASVGLINCHVEEDSDGDITIGTKNYRYTDITKHDDIQGTGLDEKVYGFALSWPYEFTFIPADPKSDYIGGKATVNVTDGRIEGYVFGGSKGEALERYREAFCANVRETEVNINYTTTETTTEGSTNCIVESVYGGGEDGHVYEDANVNITGGLIGVSVYGGGKGEGTYRGKLRSTTGSHDWGDETDISSWTAGKVYGNTSVTMTGGHVMVNVYGGGNRASVGKGNYASGTDDYYTAGYGETLTNEKLWTSESGYDPSQSISDTNKPDYAWHFLNSGKVSVTITGGTVGTLNGLYSTVGNSSEASMAGMVFGGSRGKAAEDVMLNPRYAFAPDFYLGYVNETYVTIGGGFRCIKECTDKNDKTHTVGEAMSLIQMKSLFDSTDIISGDTPSSTYWEEITGDGPRIYSQVFGGGRDGHVRNSTHVVINKGIIGQSYSETEAVGTTTADYQRRNRGNVYGSGSGMGFWNTESTHHGMSSGSVTRNTTVDVYGGTIYGNVYGGGAMSSVGPPLLEEGKDYAPETWSKCTVNIHGGNIGWGQEYESVYQSDYDKYGYGGCVFGASRGGDYTTGESPDNYATTIWNDVNIMGGTIAGNVYGGGQASRVKKDNFVNLLGGTIAHDAYGGGQGTTTIASDVGGNTTVELNKKAAEEAEEENYIKGCIVDRIFGCNDLNGSPKGHVLVHVYATQNKNTENVSLKVAPPTYSSKRNTNSDPEEGYKDYLRRIIDVTYKKNGEDVIIVPHEYIDARITPATIEAAEEVLAGLSEVAEASLSKEQQKSITDAANTVIKEIDKMFDYDVTAVYGGGNLAIYRPYGPAANNTDADYKATRENTDVVIEGCNVTSIKQVYGGGNAASVPATNVTVSSVFVIDELFGGGNGLDSYQLDGKWYENPGANIGYYATEEHIIEGNAGDGLTEGTKYESSPKENSTEKSDRETHYSYGTGYATTTVTGGRIHTVYGGSNEKGNIRTVALSQYQKAGTCPLITNETYGGSKKATMDGEIQVVLDCVEEGGTYYGGSQDADINNNVTINITNGKYYQIYGGNNKAGSINGVITINIEEKGCTPIFIDELYGGGYYAPYSVYGYKKKGDGTFETIEETDPTDGTKKINSRIPLKAGDTGALTEPHRDPYINIISATRIGSIFGGGNRAKVIGSPHINVNMQNGKVLANYANNANSDGKYISIKDAFTATTHGTGDDAYTVESVGVGKDATLAIGKIGNIYGGGNMADVVGSTYVDIGTGVWLNSDGKIETEDADGKIYIYNETTQKWDWTQVIEGETTSGTVETKPAPVRKAAFITGSVFGGGKMGHVGDFTLTDGKPTSCADGTGTCYVTISNGEIGLNDMKMEKYDEDDKPLPPDDAGHVFGAGQGTVNIAETELLYSAATWASMTDEQKLAGLDNLAYVNKTEVVINGDAFIKGSVYGGGFDGHVLGDTHVTIDGNCQIGNGWDTTLNSGAGGGVNRRYTDKYAADVWTNRTTYPSLPECASWPYTSPYKAHDMFANATGDLDKYSDNTTPAAGRRQASDGHTFYGNVFGGGSGYYPAAPGLWVHKAGWVEGNTLVEIKGGHVLTSIYGGNEMTNVGTGLSGAGGKCTVRMSGGTLGVPRTLTQIAAHPVTCYLFGAGKGDQNVLFNRETNVKEVEVEVTGGTIFGSVFGGGEDGHVLGDVKMTIGNDDGTGPTIGTWGTSYVDGNIFGGGRGFSGEALTSGNVGGSIKMDIKGGTMLGSIYGGGRLGSVGYGLYNADDDNYGVMLADNVDEFGTTTTYYTSTGMNKKGRGHIDINITGGTIGNSHEYIIPQASNIPTGLAADFTTWSDDDWTTWQNHNNVPNTEYDTSNGRVTHTKGGNVFAGAMGRRTALNGSVISNWEKLGNAKSTKLTISGANTWIMGNVYGGGEFGAVTGNHNRLDGSGNPLKDDEDKNIVSGTEILINGGTIGTEVTGSTPEKETITTTPSGVQYTFGSVYGGGYGTEAEIADITVHDHADKLGAYVADSTYINMTTGLVRASVYGGGEIAAVGGNSNVNISGGKIGRNEVYSKTEPYKGGAPNPGYVKFGSSTMGNVFGGGKGTDSHTLVGVVKGNTNINISAGDGVPTGEPFIYHNVYGGGAYGSVGTFNFSDGKNGDMQYIPKGIPFNWDANTGVATVNIKGGTIGISGRDNGMVNGSSRGDIAKPVPTEMWSIPSIHSIDKDPYDKMAWVEQSIVNIGETGEAGPHIKGSVYGGGENGHVFTHATVNVKGGTIGIVDEKDPWYDFGNTSINEAAWVTRGNVYGGGCGTDTYWDDKNSNGVVDDGEEHYNAWAGCVIGNTDVNISGGLIAQSVYGGGSMGSVGRVLEGKDIVEHKDETNGFVLSWPVKFVYQDLTVEDPVEKTHSTGKATVRITGGRIGTTGSDNGDVFGGTRGIAGDRYELAEFGNVRETEVIVDFTPPSTDAINPIEDGGKYKLRIDLKDGSDNFVNAIAGSVYGGCENGHVNENTKVDVRNGLIGHAIYGGGKGKGTYPYTYTPTGSETPTTVTVASITAGKVYGNTQVTMSNGYVLRNIYGGGNLGSVGKGNYAGGSDDYASGYGEKITGNLWTSASDGDDAWQFLHSGKTTVNVLGGTVGFLPTSAAQLAAFEKDDLPTGNVFGACRGQASAETESLVFNPATPDFFLGYVNETDVNIGGYRCKTQYSISETTYKVGDCITAEQYADLASGKDNWDLIGPTIYGSVYGGGQDGHVRRDTKINVYRGEIGVPYSTANQGIFGGLQIDGKDNLHWLHRGNVYGGGSGIGTYKDNTGEHNSSSAGSVTRNTNVNIMGGTIHRNVYGGGSLASVTAPSIAMALATPGTSLTDAVHGKQSFNTLNIAGTIGTPDDFIDGFKYNKVYGGEVYGASRGEKALNSNYFGLSVWTLVNIKNGAHILGNVFGGGDAGKVLKDSKVVVGAE